MHLAEETVYRGALIYLAVAPVILVLTGSLCVTLIVLINVACSILLHLGLMSLMEISYNLIVFASMVQSVSCAAAGFSILLGLRYLSVEAP